MSENTIRYDEPTLTVLGNSLSVPENWQSSLGRNGLRFDNGKAITRRGMCMCIGTEG